VNTRTPRPHPEVDPTVVSDAELCDRVRAGDIAAFGELWTRHEKPGRAAAASITSTFDADDVVAESFLRILDAMQAGHGPTRAFRPYLYATIRSTAARWGRQRREIPIEHAETIEDDRFSEESNRVAIDRALSKDALKTLPTRWQQALWYSEVEEMSASEIAPLLGMTPNAVAALTYRARDGLRKAWGLAHANPDAGDTDL
jgi:RNA polymerase sigma factor (sigma-70 family)